MTAFKITATRTLRQRKNGEISFFDGEIDGLHIRIQTKAGDALRCTVEDGALVPSSAEAAGLLAQMIDAAATDAAARSALLARKRSEAEARVEAIMADILKSTTADDRADAEPLLRAWRSAAAQRVAEEMRLAQEWPSIESDVRTIAMRLVYHPSPAVRRAVTGA